MPSHLIIIDKTCSESCQLQMISKREQILGLFLGWLWAGLEPTKFHSLALPSFGLKECTGNTLQGRKTPNWKGPSQESFHSGVRLCRRMALNAKEQDGVWNNRGTIVSYVENVLRLQQELITSVTGGTPTKEWLFQKGTLCWPKSTPAGKEAQMLRTPNVIIS